MTSQSVPSQGNAVVSMTAQHDDGIPRSGIASSATAAGGVPWSQAFDPQAAASPANARRRSEQRYLRSTIVAFLLFTMAFAVLFTPFILQQRATEKESQVADAAASHVMGWPSGKAERMFAQARAYNHRLALSGQPVIGEAADPFAPSSSASDATANTTEAWRHDTEYLSLLNASHGVMGSIRIPKISVNLPIYHGTSDAVLDDGVGHVYGTSLPVGGAGSHSVLTAHRGLSDKTLFTRLDELRVGDPFYIKIMNETLGYRVISITTIKPSEINGLTIRKGQDLVTLMTCTPYGVNTHRLLVTGRRANIPKSIPEPDDATQDTKQAKTVALAVAAVTLVYGLLATRFRPRPLPVRHRADGSPLRGSGV
ncbi:class C sortase [Bifidobacterium thermacidophilum]|uniref:class C sortase n=1 Tax=Bifidobacterium thermacidophilum TaxID=246618 RepID=UPI003F0EDDC8